MSRTYTKREMAYILGCSERTIEDDVRFLKIVPSVGDRNKNLYSQRDYELIKQMRSHCGVPGNSRTGFVEKPSVSIVEKQPRVTKIRNVETQYRESISFGLQNDPLFDLVLLQRISDNQWLLPANRLAPIFNISAKYLSSIRSYEYCGFIATVEVRSKGSFLWKVSANNS